MTALSYDISTPHSAMRIKHSVAEKTDVLRRRRGTVALVTLAFFGAAYAWSMTATPLYTAQTQILIDPREKRVMDNASMPIDNGLIVVESQMKVMTSDAILLKVIEREKLTRDKEFGGREKGSFEMFRSLALALNLTSDGSPEQRALKMLSKNVAVTRADRAFMVDLKVTTTDATKSARIANAILDSFVTDLTETHIGVTKKTGTALTSRLETMKQDVKKAEEKVEAYKFKNNLVGTGGKLVSEQQLGDVSNQLVQARAKVGELRSRIEQLQRFERSGGDMATLSEVAQSQTIASLKNQLSELTRQEADLLTTLGPRHPQVLSVQKQSADLKKLMSDEVRSIISTIRGDYDRAMGAEKSLTSTVNELKNDQHSASSSFVALRELEREADTARNIYNAFLNRSREVSEQEKIDPSNVRVLSQASIPHEKSWPPTALLLPLSLLIGFLVGAMIAFMKEAGDDSLHSKSQIERLTGIPMIGALPSFGLFSRDKHYSEVLDRPQSKFSKMTKRIFALGSVQKNANATKYILVVSDRENNARPALVMNLALLSASQGLRVLVIDGSFKSRALTLQTGQNMGGVSELANGKSLSESMMFDRRTGVHLLTTGEALKGMTAAIAEKILRETGVFNLVLIDAGSIIDDATTGLFVKAADDILIACEYGKAKQNSLNEVLVALREQAHKARGIIMTHAPNGLITS
jgi:polysaccharide biosynthesis transport protein